MIRLVALALLAVAPASSADEGRALYRAGDGANPTACAACHGLSGEGRREGGLEVPPIAQVGYSDAELARLLASGVARDGRHVAVMPRFSLRADQLHRLNAYLAILGSEEDGDPGVSANTVRIGAALPLSGPRSAEARAMVLRLDRMVGEANAAGGIYGRRIELAVVDIAGSDRAALAKCFALVASPPSIRVGDQPLVGALAPTPAVDNTSDEPTFYLLPANRADMSRLLAHVGEPQVGPFLADSAMRLVLQAMAASGRSLNRARFVTALESLAPMKLTGPHGREIRLAFRDGNHVVSAELLTGQ